MRQVNGRDASMTATGMANQTRARARRLAMTVVLALGALFAAPAGVQAAASDWASHEHGKLRLISAGQTVGESGTLRLGLDFKLADGWKIYWRSPGEAGYPPKLDVSGSTNLADVEIRWPVPHRFELFGLQTFGYGKRIVLPVDARAKDPDKPVRVNANVDYLTCADICVPRRAELAITIPPGGAKPGDHAHLIETYRARVPGEGAGAGLGLQSVGMDGTEAVTVTLRASPPLAKPDAVIENAKGHSFGKPEVTLADGGKRADLRLPVRSAKDAPALTGQTVTLTVFDGDRGLERRITLGEPLDADGTVPGGDGSGGNAAGGSGTPWTAVAGMLGLALLGGLILNLMPCVLPVLSLKLIAVVDHGGEGRRQTRIGFLASAAGIVVSFLGFAVGAIALQGMGEAVGWGMQFQHPAFLVAMTLVVTGFACNLFGLFEIPMPRVVGAAASRVGGNSALVTHFATGVLATLLATPCSAPFLGTAVGFALSRGVGEILAIFTALGIGLALPYLLVAALPGLASHMPRPGRWMLRVKQVMGLLLVGTAVWLLTVLAAQRGTEVAIALAGLVVAGSALIALRGRIAPALGRRAVPAGLAVVAVAAFATPPSLGSAPATRGGADGEWRALDTARIDRLVGDGKIVFVDVTAEWCITCKVNKTAVIDSTRIQRLLDRDGVVRMRGDWTRRDSRIAAYLATFERYGIPFNAVYGPDAPDGIVLPEVLTRRAVVDAVDQAG
jgi:suppressor for copper-sensitivity B